MLSQLHRVNTTTILVSSKDMSGSPWLVDDYSAQVLEFAEFENPKTRFDWFNEGGAETVKSRQRELSRAFGNEELELLKKIKEQQCKTKCENWAISLQSVQYSYGTLRALIEKNYVLVQLGKIKFFN